MSQFLWKRATGRRLRNARRQGNRRHEVSDKLLSSLLANYKKPEDLIGGNGLLKQLTKLLVEKALDAEMSEHLGQDRHEPVANAAGNARNGRSNKTLQGECGALPIEIPRDHLGCFEPRLIAKHQTRWVGFDDKILSLYARHGCARDPGAPGGDVRRAGVGEPDLDRHRRGDRGSCWRNI